MSVLDAFFLNQEQTHGDSGKHVSTDTWSVSDKAC